MLSVLRTGRCLAGLALAVMLSVNPATARANPGQHTPAPGCDIEGTIVSGRTPLPGVRVRARSASGALLQETVSRIDGTYRLREIDAGTYRLVATLPGFVDLERNVSVTASLCDGRVDLTLTLAPPGEPPAGPDHHAAVRTGQPPVDPAAAAERLGVPLPVVDRPAAAFVEFNGRLVRPERAWLAERRRAAPAALPTAAEAALVRPPSAAAAAPARPAQTPRALPARVYQGSVSYSVNGSALDSRPYQLRPDRPVDERPYSRQTVSVSLSGPLRVPRLYEPGRRTTFALTWSGNRGSTLFDQYATVPTEAVRAGDFSGAPAPLIDPETGQPFPAQRIPAERVHPAARSLLPFIPTPNLPGTSRNFHYTTTSHSRSNNLTLRVVHELTRPPAGRPAAGAARTTASLTAQVQIRDNRSVQDNVFPALGGTSLSRTVSVPVTLAIQRGKHTHSLSVTVSQSLQRAESRYAFVEDVAATAGIAGLSQEPFTWGVPTLSFSTYASARDVNPTQRRDDRIAAGYSWRRTVGSHSLTAGGEARLDRSDNQSDPNSRGTFVFTGRYTAGSSRVPRGAGFDFADFLLGLPQQASVRFGPGEVRMRGRSFAVYVQDDWRRTKALTITLGLRYELILPLLEADRQMVNLDVRPDFTEVAPVLSGAAGPFTGSFPAGLMRTDRDNLAPRLALAWKGPRAVTLRTGYGVSVNSGPYSAIARRLVSQPPFAASQENLGTPTDPLDLADPFRDAAIAAGDTTFGVDRDYALGIVQTWTAEISRPFRTIWTASGGYTGKRGTSLDLMRTPNRDPDAAAFQWQSADGRSIMHGLTLRLQRRKTRGLGGTVTYTLARSRDNMALAQNDADLDAEWSLSSFDRRHQLACDLTVDLPLGPGRAWLTGGRWASLAAGWSATATFTAQSGTPLTPRVTGAIAANRPLRPDLTGEPIALPSPTVDLFFNTAAFALPEPGEFGTTGRNAIIGPGSRLLNASLARDVRLGGTRVLTARLNATNLLNLVNYGAVNTTVNSTAFGQVTSVRPMRTMTLSAQIRF